MSTVLPRFLLIEPQFVLRRTIAMVAREQGVVDFQEASNVGRARALLAGEAFEGVVIDLHEGPLAMALLGELRQGQFATRADARVIALATDGNPVDAARLQALGVAGVLGKPVRISDLLGAIVDADAHDQATLEPLSLLSTRWPGRCRDACLCSCLYVLGGHILPAQGGILLQY